MTIFLGAAPLALAAMAPVAVPDQHADHGYPADTDHDILVTSTRHNAMIEANPNPSTASIDAATIDRTVNAVNVEDALKYLPSLVVRKRHIGDTQAPLATRTSGVAASARSLIFADGALLSSLIGNNNTTASPQWQLVSPQEIARIDVLYGPYSAAYAGNSIGAVVNITTRLPDRLEADINAGTSVQTFSQYGTRGTFPAYDIGATLGDRWGRLALFASYSHVSSDSQPLAYATANRAASPSSSGNPTTGGFDDVNRFGAPIRVLGATGLEHQEQDFAKLKLAFDLTPDIRLSYIGGAFVNATNDGAASYLSDASGAPVFAGNLNIGGYSYSVPSTTFSNNVYRTRQTHWSHSWIAQGTQGPVDFHIVGTLFDYARDDQRVPSTALPGAFAGGAGNLTRLNGTGWYTVDAKASVHLIGHDQLTVAAGYHRDQYSLNSNRYTLAANWLSDAPGALNQISRGTTQTDAAWGQIAWRPVAPLLLTIGGRQEWWQARDGYNFSVTPALSVVQPRRAVSRFSPKATLAWTPSKHWQASASFGEAWRFPTVMELYQVVTTGPSLTSPNPTLRPEQALSEELAVQRNDGASYARLSLFHELINNALLTQSTPLVPGSTTLYSYFQNVDRIETYGLELAFQQSNLLPGIDLSGSVTLTDPRVRADAALPAAIGKRPPQVPTQRATLVATWHPGTHWSLSAAGRYSGRSFAVIDNSDPVSFTYQGFGSYFVADVRATVDVTRQFQLALGMDNLTDRRYYLFHPFPGRSFRAEMRWRL
ncbi:MAG: TonB-dependent receptor [Sphingomonas sp.]